VKIALVACCKEKRTEPLLYRAEFLYVPDLFFKASAWARKNSDTWRILSAQHSVVEPWQWLAAYDTTISDLTKSQRDRWLAHACERLGGVVRNGDTVYVLAGDAYCKLIVPLLKNKFYATVERPLEGMGIGEQKAWLKAEMAGHHGYNYSLCPLPGWAGPCERLP
jgi:hypothetical protein